MPARRLLASLAAVASVAACERPPITNPLPDPAALPPAVTIASAAMVASASAAPSGTASSGPKALALPPPGEDTDATCRRYAQVPLPAADQPTATERKALAECDGEALYYGIGRQPDLEAARKCAYVERDRTTSPLGGDAILLMIYADGKGVPPNLDLAVRFACEAGGAPAEVGGRVDRLIKARREGRTSETIDFCEDISSGFMAGSCVQHGERIRKVEREARKQVAIKGMPAAAVARLDTAAQAFFSARSMKEVDLSGTGRGAFAIGEEATLADDHLATLEQLADPSFSPPKGDAVRTERALQSAYDRVMKCRRGPPPDTGTIDAAGIKATETLWLSYREAWLSLVSAAQPKAPRDRWKAWLSAKRTKMLEDIGCP
jgi:hypothetical protein